MQMRSALHPATIATYDSGRVGVVTLRSFSCHVSQVPPRLRGINGFCPSYTRPMLTTLSCGFRLIRPSIPIRSRPRFRFQIAHRSDFKSPGGKRSFRHNTAKEWPSPGGPESGPYGITTLNDLVWYSESGKNPNTLVRFDPKTETFQTWPIPSGGGVVRNMMPTADGNLVLACSGVNRIALVVVTRR
jgi:hypothetical protein